VHGAGLGLLCVALVGVRGVRWDEDYEFAQVLLGRIVYPDDHPMPLHVRGMFGVQHWSLAAWMALVPGEAPANGLRNVLFLLATLAPPFALARCWTGHAAWGYVAAALALLGLHVPFYSTYPVQVWPDLYSNGHIGGAWMLLAVAALAGGQVRLAYLMAGLAPAIHLGQSPPLLAVIAIHAAWSLWRFGWAAQRGALCAGALGLGLSLSLWLFVRWQAPAVDVDPASYARIFRGYMTHHATHRAIPWGTGHLALLGTLGLAAAATCSPRRLDAPGNAQGPGLPGMGWVACYLLLVAGMVYGVMAVHLGLGSEIPRALIAWMPYRLINHAGPVAMALLVALLARGGVMAGLLFAALALAIARPALSGLIPEAWHGRYVAEGEGLLFLLHGAAWALICLNTSTGRRNALVAAGIAGLVGLALTHQFGAACWLVGAGFAWTTRHARVPGPGARVAGTAAALVFVCLAVQQYQSRAHLPRSAFEERVAQALAQETAGGPVLVPHLQEGLQARLNHPVMTDMATITWVPYSPAAALAVDTLYRDLYGIRIAPGPGEAAHAAPWFEVWPAKSAEEWNNLSRVHGFHFVIAPKFMKLPLEPVLDGAEATLYRVTP
jgi:hypothetical protein